MLTKLEKKLDKTEIIILIKPNHKYYVMLKNLPNLTSYYGGSKKVGKIINYKEVTIGELKKLYSEKITKGYLNVTYAPYYLQNPNDLIEELFGELTNYESLGDERKFVLTALVYYLSNITKQHYYHASTEKVEKIKLSLEQPTQKKEEKQEKIIHSIFD